jgi:hypothetical protein
MNGPIAQIVAMTCHLNAALREGKRHLFFPGNSTCQFCESITFRTHALPLPALGRWSGVWRTPEDWFDWAINQKFQRAALFRQSTDLAQFPDRMSAAFVGGGGQWLLGVQKGDVLQLWAPRWRVANQNAPDRRIWRVAYVAVGKNAWQIPTGDLSQVAADFAAALMVVEQFASKQGLDFWAERFRNALACLISDDPMGLASLKDLAPVGLLDLPALQLLAASQSAWVFGGMGSWNDLLFDGEDQVRYDVISQQLFDVVNQAICCATNAVLSFHR